MSDGIVYKPSAWQAKFHALTHREALGAGAAGPGKTECLIHEPLQQIRVEHARMTRNPELAAAPGTKLYEDILKHPINPGQSVGWALFLRRIYTTLEQTVARCKRTYFALDPGCEWVESKRWFQFSSGYKVQFDHCKDIGDWEKYMSLEFTMILYDELVQFDQEQYIQINGRLRTSDPILKHMRKIRAMSNPVMKLAEGTKVRDPHWVRKHFVDPAPEGNVTIKKKMVRRSDGSSFYRRRIYLPAKLKDNPDPEFVRSYEEELLNQPKHVREALMDGNWYITAGSFFGEVWEHNLHVCRPFRIPQEWKRFRSMDWGMKSYGVVLWFAMDPDENVWVEREYTFKGKRADEVAKDVRDIEVGMKLWRGRKSLITGPADTQLWEERGDVGMTKAAVFHKLGVPWTKAEKVRLTNAQRVYSRLKDHNHGTQTPGLVIFQTCKHLIRTLPALPTDQNCPELPMDGGDDHWYDALCYGVAYASKGRRAIPSHHKDLEHERSSLEDDDRGTYGYG